MDSSTSNYKSTHVLTQPHKVLASLFSQLQNGAGIYCPAHLSGPQRTQGHDGRLPEVVFIRLFSTRIKSDDVAGKILPGQGLTPAPAFPRLHPPGGSQRMPGQAFQSFTANAGVATGVYSCVDTGSSSRGSRWHSWELKRAASPSSTGKGDAYKSSIRMSFCVAPAYMLHHESSCGRGGLGHRLLQVFQCRHHWERVTANAPLLVCFWVSPRAEVNTLLPKRLPMQTQGPQGLAQGGGCLPCWRLFSSWQRGLERVYSC